MKALRLLLGLLDGALRSLLVALVRAYRFLLSPWVGNQCRFYPSCSQYALGALGRHGGLRGGLMSLCRILRCNPWGGGGVDEVPAVFQWRCLCGSAAHPDSDQKEASWNCSARS